MPSPDVSPYVDLKIYDDSSQNIYLRAIDYAQVSLPELLVREGSIEAVLLQAMALEVQEAVYAINRLPGAITEVLLKLLDVERQTGDKATASVKFSGLTTASFVVPSGTRLFYQDSSSSTPLVVLTLAEVVGLHTRIISSITRTGTAVTVVTTERHGLAVGDLVSISGTPTLNESNRPVTGVTSLTTFTYTSTTSGSASATTGTVTPSGTVPARVVVDVESVDIGSDFNGLATGTTLSLLSVLSGVATASLAEPMTGGTFAETDAEYFTRSKAVLGRLSTVLATAQQMQDFVLDGRFPSVYRCKAVDNSDKTRGSGLAGNSLVVIAPIDSSPTVFFDGVGDGSLVPTSVGYGLLDGVHDAVTERSHAALAVNVSHPTFVTIQVQASVARVQTFSSLAVEQACTSALNAYLSTNQWNWSQIVRVNEVANVLRSIQIAVGTETQQAVDYISSTTLTPTDIDVPSVSTVNRFTISTIARSSSTATITTSSAHGVVINPGETLYLKVAGVTNATFNTTGLVTALSASGSQFTFTQSGTNTSSSGGYVIAAIKKLSNGDIQILDPAPLVQSATHSITVS
jgi:hypothetical protein